MIKLIESRFNIVTLISKKRSLLAEKYIKRAIAVNVTTAEIDAPYIENLGIKIKLSSIFNKNPARKT